MPVTPPLAPQDRLTSLLVVDDSSTQRAHAVQLCRALGVELLYEAHNGQEALELLEMLHLPPDIMLTDLHMPVMDGVELLTHMHERGHKIPMLVASSQPASVLNAVEELGRTLGMPMLGTLAKPLQSLQLEAAFNRYRRCNKSVFKPAARVTPRMPLAVRDLCDAIDRAQIDVHYQPKVDIRTGLVRGMEVLARWTHPQLGAVPADQFIALAEKERLIHDLTLVVLDKALEQAALWRTHGFHPKLAINLSPLLLSEVDIVHEITQLTQRHDIKPAQVVLEITESAGVEHLGRAIAVLTRLRLKGFGLSLDDYGTGFSSMQQLARLPFTELKIDRGFVHGAHRRRHLHVILESALEMARRLDLVTVAEGIETLEDWHLLRRSGCAIGQGYLIARPMPASDVPQWMAQHHRRRQELLAPAPTPQETLEAAEH